MRFISTMFLSAAILTTGFVSSKAQAPKNASNELVKLLGSANGPRSFNFCDADKSTRRCKGAKGLKAGGLGGAFIPLGLEVKGFKIVGRNPAGNNVQIVSRFETEVNKVAPKCKDAEGTINASSDKLEFKGFYCNWLAIGNVVARITLDVDNVDARRKTFSGKYTLRLVGTGNMFGKGYFTAKGG